jgi:hypothetical protein
MEAMIVGPDLLIVFFIVPISLALIGLPLFCIIDAAQRSSLDFQRADSNKVLWIVLPLLFGVLAAIVYLVAVRPNVKAAASYSKAD